jgi:hypothetical protein
MITLNELLHDIQIEIDRAADNGDDRACAWYCNLYEACDVPCITSPLIQAAHSELVNAIVNNF